MNKVFTQTLLKRGFFIERRQSTWKKQQLLLPKRENQSRRVLVFLWRNWNAFARKMGQSQCCGWSVVGYWQSMSVCWWLSVVMGRWWWRHCESHPSRDPSHSSVLPEPWPWTLTLTFEQGLALHFFQSLGNADKYMNAYTLKSSQRNGQNSTFSWIKSFLHHTNILIHVKKKISAALYQV